MVIAAFRTTGSAFSVTRYAIVPSPCPSLPDVISIQLACGVADHAHSRATVTFTSPVPPDDLKLDDGAAIATWHRVAVGPVTFVTAELPHPAVIDATAPHSRATRIFTVERYSSGAPATMERA
jgi:hypothetical protein